MTLKEAVNAAAEEILTESMKNRLQGKTLQEYYGDAANSVIKDFADIIFRYLQPENWRQCVERAAEKIIEKGLRPSRLHGESVRKVYGDKAVDGMIKDFSAIILTHCYPQPERKLKGKETDESIEITPCTFEIIDYIIAQSNKNEVIAMAAIQDIINKHQPEPDGDVEKCLDEVFEHILEMPYHDLEKENIRKILHRHFPSSDKVREALKALFNKVQFLELDYNMFNYRHQCRFCKNIYPDDMIIKLEGKVSKFPHKDHCEYHQARRLLEGGK